MMQRQTLDPAQLQVWRDLLSDPAEAWVIRDLIDSFLSECASHLAAFRSALQAEDLGACRFLAHRLQGCSSVVGARQMLQICADMEALTKAKNPSLTRLGELLTKIEEEYCVVKQALEQEHH